MNDPVAAHMISKLTSDAAIGTDRVDRLFRASRSDRRCGEKRIIGHARSRSAQKLGHQRAGRAGLHALAAAHAGGGAERVVQIEDDLRGIAPPRVADHVIDLLLPASTRAAAALDAGIEIDRDRRMAHIRYRLLARCKAWRTHPHPRSPLIQFRVFTMRRLGHVRQQQLEHHFLCGPGAVASGMDSGAGRWCATAGGGEHALALDLDHAGAAVAVGSQAIAIAEVGNVDAMAARDLKQCFARARFDCSAIEFEGDHRG